MQIRGLLAFVTLIGCSCGAPSNSSSANIGVGSAGAVRSSSNALTKADVRLPSGSPHGPDLRYYPMSDYRDLPPSVGSMMRNADMEQDYCRNAPESDLRGYRACNRSWHIMRRLERRGWCWGDEHRDRVGADEHWLRCSHDPTYRPNYLGNRPPFTAREIRERIRESSR